MTEFPSTPPVLLAKLGVWLTVLGEGIWIWLVVTSSDRLNGTPPLWELVGLLVVFGTPLALAGLAAWVTWRGKRLDYLAVPSVLLAVFGVLLSLFGSAVFLIPAVVLGLSAFLAGHQRHRRKREGLPQPPEGTRQRR